MVEKMENKLVAKNGAKPNEHGVFSNEDADFVWQYKNKKIDLGIYFLLLNDGVVFGVAFDENISKVKASCSRPLRVDKIFTTLQDAKISAMLDLQSFCECFSDLRKNVIVENYQEWCEQIKEKGEKKSFISEVEKKLTQGLSEAGKNDPYIKAEIAKAIKENKTSTPNKTRLLIESFATVEHVNNRKEGSEDDKKLVIDIKLKTETMTDLELLKLFDDKLAEFIWKDDGTIRSHRLDDIGFVVIQPKLLLTIGEIEIPECTAKKFKFSFLDNAYTITFTVSCSPSAGDIEKILQNLGELVKIKLTEMPNLFQE